MVSWYQQAREILRCRHDLTDKNKGAQGRSGYTDPQSDDC